eukprot:4132237-Prorocentrum_lima.AAC.1
MTPSSTKETRDPQEDHEVQREELYLPHAIQDEVKKGFEHGFINPAAGLKKYTSDMQGSC